MTTRERLDRHSYAVVVVAFLVVGALLLLPAFLLVWFSPGLDSGALCNLGMQPRCAPGHGLVEWYTLAAVVAVSVACLLASLWVGRRGGSVTRLVMVSVLLAASALGWTLVRDEVRPHLPHGWLM